MMKRKYFRRREQPEKSIVCSCGNEAKLIKRRNFSHGRKSKGKSYMVYKCRVCKKEIPLTKLWEVRK